MVFYGNSPVYTFTVDRDHSQCYVLDWLRIKAWIHRMSQLPPGRYELARAFISSKGVRHVNFYERDVLEPLIPTSDERKNRFHHLLIDHDKGPTYRYLVSGTFKGAFYPNPPYLLQTEPLLQSSPLLKWPGTFPLWAIQSTHPNALNASYITNTYINLIYHYLEQHSWHITTLNDVQLINTFHDSDIDCSKFTINFKLSKLDQLERIISWFEQFEFPPYLRFFLPGWEMMHNHRKDFLPHINNYFPPTKKNREIILTYTDRKSLDVIKWEGRVFGIPQQNFENFFKEPLQLVPLNEKTDVTNPKNQGRRKGVGF